MKIIALAGASNVSFYLPLLNYSKKKKKKVNYNLRESNPSWVESCIASLQSVTIFSLSFLFLIYIYLFIWLCQVLVTGIFNCGMQT